jgi:hypothetical protein
MRGNLLPSVDEHSGRVVVIGNWLHTDGLMARLKNTGIFTVLEFPLLRKFRPRFLRDAKTKGVRDVIYPLLPLGVSPRPIREEGHAGTKNKQ